MGDRGRREREMGDREGGEEKWELEEEGRREGCRDERRGG